MIDFYGGGGNVSPKDYFANEPIHNVPKWPPGARSHLPNANAEVVSDIVNLTVLIFMECAASN